MYKILDLTDSNLIALQVEGKIVKTDYELLNTLLRNVRENYDTIRLYLEINNIEGIEPSAVWEDIKTYFRHFRDIDRVAVISSDSTVKTLTNLGKTFVSGETRFFNDSDFMRAREWIRE
jgi:hypothetical protein